MELLHLLTKVALALCFTCSASSLELQPMNNTCMDHATEPPPGPRSFDCRRFVIESTDQTWHQRSWNTTEAAIEKYFAKDWHSVRAFGTLINGRSGLKSFMRQWLEGFPDVFIRVSDLFCEGNDVSGYKTTMPYVLTATNTGPSAFGLPTGRSVKYHGIANCFIKKMYNGEWMYTNEWDVPDMWSFMVQLGLPIDQQKHPSSDLMGIDQCEPLFEWGSGKMNWFPSPERAIAANFTVLGSPLASSSEKNVMAAASDLASSPKKNVRAAAPEYDENLQAHNENSYYSYYKIPYYDDNSYYYLRKEESDYYPIHSVGL